MKNKFLGLTTLALSSLALMASASAAVKITGDDTIGYIGSNVTVTTIDADKKEYKLTLTGTANEDLLIQTGETVTIDLDGNIWTNYNNQSTAIEVQNGATLIIKDSKGTGKITYNNNTAEGHVSGAYAPLISNAGELTLESGLIEVNKGAFKGTGILNTVDGKLYVEGGSVKTTVDNSWGITNEGTAIINSGNFVQGGDFSIIQNAKDLTINDGTFTTTPEGTHYSLITNSDTGSPSLKILNGTFETSTKLFHKSTAVDENTDIVIMGGKYPVALEEEVVKYLASEDYEFLNGEVVTDADYSELEEALAEAAKVVITKYTEETIANFNEAYAAAQKIEKVLKSNEQDKIDEAAATLKLAISSLKEIVPEAIQPNDTTTSENPKTFDNVLGYVVLAIGALGCVVVVTKKILNK